MTRVMVVGGYGAVGRSLCQELAGQPDIELIVAGRRLDAAKAFAAEIGAEARRIDLIEAGSWAAACGAVEVVVMCMDQADTRFVAYLFERRIHYVDVTASDAFFRDLERLATPAGVSALLSVGLAPGLTNLLVALLAGRLDEAQETSIGLMIGLGDSHGRAGIEWMADRLFDPGQERRSANVDFGRGWGVRKAYAVDFADQHALVRTLPIAEASTSVALDSPLATRLLFGFACRFGGSRLARRSMVWLVEHVRIGSKTLNIGVAVTGRREGQQVTERAWFFGQSESWTTGRLAAVMVRRFLEIPLPPGIWHSHQILDPGSVFDEVVERCIGLVEAKTCE